ncbi:type IV toxin-antitoxin system AbiEi family antitoxin domain-containing protein [Lacrimispora brassicae]
MMTDERILKINRIFKEYYPIVKTCVLRENKICSRDITELMELDYIVKVKTGYYAWRNDVKELSGIELVQSIIPEGVISLESAATIHKLIGENTLESAVCVTIPTNMIKPTLPVLPEIKLFYCSEEKLHIGRTSLEMKNRTIAIYNKERTVCDLFKYLDRVNNDIALESLKKYMEQKDKNVQKLLEYAYLLRVKKYVEPLIEVLI